MSQLLRYLSLGLVLFSTIASVHAESLIPSEIEIYLNQHNLKLTTKAEDAQKAGYILVMGTGKGLRLDAKRAATVSAQRAIAAILAEFPAEQGNVTKKIVKTATQTKTTVSGKVKQITPVFSYYNPEQETMYLLMRKTLVNQRSR